MPKESGRIPREPEASGIFAETSLPRGLRLLQGWKRPGSSETNSFGQLVLSAQRRLATEDFVDFFSELKIEIADALHAVGIEVDDDLVPHVEPFGVVIHPFRD